MEALYLSLLYSVSHDLIIQPVAQYTFHYCNWQEQ